MRHITTNCAASISRNGGIINPSMFRKNTIQRVKVWLTWYSCRNFATVTGYKVNEEPSISVRPVSDKLQCSTIPRCCSWRWYVGSTELSQRRCVGRVSIIHSDAIEITSCVGFCSETNEGEQNNLKYTANEESRTFQGPDLLKWFYSDPSMDE